MKAGIQAPGFNFTAYLKFEYFKFLEEMNALLEDFDPKLKKIVGFDKYFAGLIVINLGGESNGRNGRRRFS